MLAILATWEQERQRGEVALMARLDRMAPVRRIAIVRARAYN